MHKTPLYDLHVEFGGKMVEFAGYQMPVQYPAGVLNEHKHTRAKASIFDVSHMGQLILKSANLGAELEKLVPSDIQNLKHGHTRYTVLLNEQGGILDDLLVTHRGDHLYLVVNASRKDQDLSYMLAHLDAEIHYIEDRALIAIQGPEAANIMSELNPVCGTMKFMSGQPMELAGMSVFVTRSGYTGEDGYEISVHNDDVERLTRLLLEHDDVELAGLGARDSLRLEAGLCLYGHDLDEETNPIEAGIRWVIQKRRREEKGFPGADKIMGDFENGPAKMRVGIKPEGRAPARAGVEVLDADGNKIGVVTSGGFGPTAEGPVAMGYVNPENAEIGSKVNLLVRGKQMPANITQMPFVPHRYYRG